MKTRKFLRVITLCLILAMCFAVPVSAAEKSTTPETPAAAAVGPVVTAPSVDMQTITVRPAYRDENGVRKTLPGYVYRRGGNNQQAIFVKVSAADKAALEKKVTDAGYELDSWQVNVQFYTSGNYSNGYVVTRIPENQEDIILTSGSRTAAFFINPEETSFKWDAYFAYRYAGKQLTQSMYASLTFLE